MGFKIRTINSISRVGLAQLPGENYEVGPDVSDPDGIIVRSASLHDVELPSSLLAIARAGAGTNNIPIADCSARGIPVFNTPGSNANAVKELVIASLFLAARNIIDAAAYAHRLRGDAASMSEAVEAGKKQFVGFELPGRTLGVIGLGSIGVEVANAAVGLGMKVLGYDPAITVKHAWKLSSRVHHITNLDTLLRQSDVVSVHVPLLDTTRSLIGRDQLALMKKSAMLVNFARAEIVDVDAVVEALEADRLRGYACDFPSPELNTRPRVLTLPHLGASTREAEENSARMAAEELRQYLEEGNITNSVNFPEAVLPKNGKIRIAIANSNVPNMVGQISTMLADAGLNIEDLLNKSRGNLAYTLVDVNSEIPDSVFARIRSIGGVLNARLIR